MKDSQLKHNLQLLQDLHQYLDSKIAFILLRLSHELEVKL